MPQLLGLIFDLDGTLVDSALDLHRALNALMASYKRRPLTVQEVKSMIGDGLQTLLQRACAATGEPLADRGTHTIFQDFLKIYQTQKTSADQLFPHARETLSSFRRKNIKIGLCTNKLYLPTLKLLEDVGITTLFDCVAGCDTYPVYKPHPGHVLGVVRDLGLSAQNCAMVGDSPNDIRAAQSAGMPAIAVAHGYSEDASSMGADALIHSFEELEPTLRRLGFDFGS